MPYKDKAVRALKQKTYGKRYRQSAKGKARLKRYQGTAKFRAANNKKMRRYRTGIGKEATASMNLQMRYGLTIREKMEMYETQLRLCALCHLPLPVVEVDGFRNICLDHDHATAVIRGLIHRRCNSLLAYIECFGITVEDIKTYLQQDTGFRAKPTASCALEILGRKL